MGSKNCGNSFHSLLSTFQLATGNSNDQQAASDKTKNTQSKESDESSKEGLGSIDKNKSFTLTENIERMYRIAQIKRATKKTSPTRDKISSENLSKCVNESGVKRERNNAVEPECSVHIGVCAVIIDDLPHEDVWKSWMETTYPDLDLNRGMKQIPDQSDLSSTPSIKIMAEAEVYIHAKFPAKVKSKWVRSKLLPISYRPNWNDVKIVRAMLALVEHALKDKRTTHILFCTESCIPITTLYEAAVKLSHPTSCSNDNEQNFTLNRSFVDAYDGQSSRCTRFDERSCWEKLQHIIPNEAIHKALPGWCVLSRKHAQSIIDIPKNNLGGNELWPVFKNVWAPEEVFFPTALALLGYLPGPEVEFVALTYAQWPVYAQNPEDRAHPYTYDDQFGAEFVSQIRQNGCLFMRKLKHPIDAHLWKDIIVREIDRIKTTDANELSPIHDRKRTRTEYKNY